MAGLSFSQSATAGTSLETRSVSYIKWGARIREFSTCLTGESHSDVEVEASSPTRAATARPVAEAGG